MLANITAVAFPRWDSHWYISRPRSTRTPLKARLKATARERFVISLAGIWIELLMCSIVTPIWWVSQPETVIHDAAYFLMMLTGLISLLVNWNPLMKLDGYHMLCEVLGIAELKEDSTAYVSAWLKRHFWRLPVEVPYVPKRRRFGFVVYALLSETYSYTVLYVVARFAGECISQFQSRVVVHP